MNKLLGLAVIVFLFFVSNAYADCGCRSNFCSSTASTGENCACTEPNCDSNSCMDRATCCRAFGNIGAATVTSEGEEDDSESFYQDYYSYNTFTTQTVYK